MAEEDRPPQPRAILRGHRVQVHAAAFSRRNERLVTGDADGFVVAWDIVIMRPRAVWQAHTKSILGVSGWGDDKLISHGRDNKLVIWQFRESDEGRLSTTLPIDPSPEPRPQPWILHILEVNTQNFCSFASCPVLHDTGSSSELLVGVPNTLASEVVSSSCPLSSDSRQTHFTLAKSKQIDIFHLPSKVRQHTVKSGKKTGMVMALSLFYRAGSLTLIAGYENGSVTVSTLDDQAPWAIRYESKSHSQPVLSLDVAPSKDFFLTSSADALIVKHPIPSCLESVPGGGPVSLSVHMIEPHSQMDPQNPRNPSSLSAGLAAQARLGTATIPTLWPREVQTKPLKVANTRHSGQQSLRIRSDGRIFATAGWDSKVRVYSTRTLTELAVLKWHELGCYATAFTHLGEVGQSSDQVDRLSSAGGEQSDVSGKQGREAKMLKATSKPAKLSVKDKRVRQAKAAHWLAVGSKDGKVSLWDIF